MTSRVTSLSMLSRALHAATLHTTRTAEAQEQISTGIRLNRASDDPLDARAALANLSKTSRLEADNRNVRASQTVLNASVARLIEAKDLLTQAKSIAISASSEFERDILAEQVDHIRNQLIRIGNTQSGGDFLFSGTALRTAPLEELEDGSIVYRGSQERQMVVVGHEITVETSYTGEEVFFGEDRSVFDVITDLRDELWDTDQPNGEVQQAMNSLIGEIDAFSDQILDVVGEQSATLENLTAVEFRTEDMVLELQKTLAELQNADIAEAVVQLQTEQNLLQYTYITTARIFELNLLNYI